MSSRRRVVAPTPLLSGSVSGLRGRPVTPLPFVIVRDVPHGGILSMRRRVSARLAFGHTPARPVSPASLEGRPRLHSKEAAPSSTRRPMRSPGRRPLVGRVGIVAPIGVGSTPDGRRSGSAPEPPGSGSGKRRVDGVARCVPRPACLVQRLSCVLSGEHPKPSCHRAARSARSLLPAGTVDAVRRLRPCLRAKDVPGGWTGLDSGGGGVAEGPGKGVDNVLLIRVCMSLR